MKHKYALYPLGMGILALCCFVVIAGFMADTVQPLWGRIFVLLLPAVLLLTLGLLACRGTLTFGKTVAITTILSLVLVILSIGYTFLLALWTATTTTTDIRYYSRAYDQIDDEEGVAGVFPRTIPEDAEDISFYYYPRFLQGGEVLELSYVITTEKRAEWEQRLAGKAGWIGSDREWREANHRTGGTDATRYQLYWDGGSNHGEISYVLIEKETNRITFYYSEW